MYLITMFAINNTQKLELIMTALKKDSDKIDTFATCIESYYAAEGRADVIRYNGTDAEKIDWIDKTVRFLTEDYFYHHHATALLNKLMELNC